MFLKKFDKRITNIYGIEGCRHIIKRYGVIIDTNTAPNWIGDNINGPAVVRLFGNHKKTFGYKFLLLFAHHQGEYIRIAGSNSLLSKWRFVPSKILNTKSYAEFHDHVASPDAHYLKNSDTLLVFFHSREIGNRKQITFLARFNGGLNNRPLILKTNLPFYARVFFVRKQAYALTKGGNLFDTLDKELCEWRPLVNIFTGQDSEEDTYQNHPGSIRHLSVLNYKGMYLVFYSIIGEKPEKIWVSELKIDTTKGKFMALGKVLVLSPEKEYEGCGLKLQNSESGPSLVPENSVRDPYVIKFRSRYLLFYSIKGEFGIAFTELNLKSIIKQLADSHA